MNVPQILLVFLIFSLPTTARAGGARPLLPENHPIAGDWNNIDNNGRDELGYYRRPSASFVLCETSESADDLTCRTFALYTGLVGSVVTARAIPIVGHWESELPDTPGLYDPETGRVELYRFVYSGTCGFRCIKDLVPLHTFVLGAGGDYPVAGDWDGNGIDSLGLVHPGGAFTLFDDSNSIPTTAVATELTLSSWIPMAGRWPENETAGDSLAFFDPIKGHFVPYDGGQQQSGVSFELRGPGSIPVPGKWKDAGDLPGLYFPKVESFACRHQIPCHEVEWFPEDFRSSFRETGNGVTGTLNSRFPNDPNGG